MSADRGTALTMVAALVETTLGLGCLLGWIAYLLAGSVLAAAVVGVASALAASFAWLLALTRRGPR